jgi:hypothetical protein
VFRYYWFYINQLDPSRVLKHNSSIAIAIAIAIAEALRHPGCEVDSQAL